MPIYGKNLLKNLLQNQKADDLGTLYVASRLEKCRQISKFAMPVAFTAKYREIIENTGKYEL